MTQGIGFYIYFQGEKICKPSSYSSTDEYSNKM